MDTLIDKIIDKPLLFKKFIVLILAYVYENMPSPVHFDEKIAKQLTGYDYNSKTDEQEIKSFFETIDFLKREGYVRCSYDYVKQTSCIDQPIFQLNIPVYLSEKGMKHLEASINNERIIDKFKSLLGSLSGKVAENVLTEKLTNAVALLLD